MEEMFTLDKLFNFWNVNPMSHQYYDSKEALTRTCMMKLRQCEDGSQKRRSDSELRHFVEHLKIADRVLQYIFGLAFSINLVCEHRSNTLDTY